MIERGRLDACLADRGLEAVWFARPNSFAWLTGGDNVVDRGSDVGVAAVGYDGDGLAVVTSNVEADRLRDEELPAGVPVTAFDWYETSLAAAVVDHSPEPAAADFDVPGFASVNASPLRHPLTDDDVARYRNLAREAAAAVESVCRQLRPDDTETEVASALRVALGSRGIEAPVALVGGAERAGTYRHFTPTDADLGGYALVSVTAERGGLHASLTRTVAFESAMGDAELAALRERHDAARTVEATALAATRAAATRGRPRREEGVRSGDVVESDDETSPEPTAGDVFDAIRDAYEDVGFPDEWTRHHQGGAAGYAGREWFAAPGSDEPVTAPMAYAYNPTVRAAKSEDTVLVSAGEDDAFEVLTDTGGWPTTTVAARGYDATVERPDVLLRSERSE